MELIKLEINNISKREDTETQNQINKLRRQFQSSNINIILGAAFSFGVVELLCSIESDLYNAEYIDKDESKVIEIKKSFFTQSILPLLDKEKIKIGESDRIKFISLLNKIIDNRQSSILLITASLLSHSFRSSCASCFGEVVPLNSDKSARSR